MAKFKRCSNVIWHALRHLKRAYFVKATIGSTIFEKFRFKHATPIGDRVFYDRESCDIQIHVTSMWHPDSILSILL